VAQNLPRDLGVEDHGDERQLAAALGAAFDIDPPRPPQKRGPCQTAWTLRIIGTGDGGIISKGGVYWINCLL
jgi:hypothetical protein